ncbi:MAG: hypothetical protein AB1806_02785 [Acidobacteriota bacterium]
MSKNAALAIAAALCIVAAGVGGYLAVRTTTTKPSAPEAGVLIRPEALESSATQPAGVAATEGVIPDAGMTGPASTVPTPAEVGGSPAAVSSAPPTATLPPAGRSEPAPARRSAPPPAERPQPTRAQARSQPPVDPHPVGTPPSAPPSAATTVPPAWPVLEVPPPVEALPPSPPPAPPEPEFEELVVSSDSVLGLRLLTTVSTANAKLEDPVEARVTRDVRVGNRVAIPIGTRLLGSVTLVERGGRMKERAKLGVRFHTLVLADSTRVPVETEAIYREGDSPGKESAAKVGAAAAGGAILGAILGGGKGAAIGGAVGAAGGTAAVMAGGRNPAVLTSGTAVTVRLQQPVTITVER